LENYPSGFFKKTPIGDQQYLKSSAGKERDPRSPVGRQQELIIPENSRNSHFRLVPWLGGSMEFWSPCAKTEHGIPFLLFLFFIRDYLLSLCKEAVDRFPATGTGPVLELAAFFAGWHLRWQQRGKMIFPERYINLSRFEETLDMPCRIFHAGKYGH
jgi:hypothetical protein